MKMNFKIPSVDLYEQYLNIQGEIDSVIKDVIKSSSFIRGPYVDNFEKMFAQIMERKYCVSCANGTDSLYIAMRALDVGPGDEVIVPAHSWISTAETVTQAGANIVFCDVDKETFTIDPAALESKITTKTVGVIPVHLYGQPANMHKIMDIADRNKLWVIEDCAQAHLARCNGKLVGTFGIAASYSFYPGKNLGAMGDAGAITTNDEFLADKMAMFARHGGLKKGEHKIEGINSRLDGIQAAILSVKLPHLLNWTKLRQSHASRYAKMLSPIKKITVPKVAEEMEHVWHLYVVKHEKRDELAKYLNSRGIQTTINYPVALPFLRAYARFQHIPEEFPNAHFNQSRILSIPIYPELTYEKIDQVVEAIDSYCKLK
ncbi:DegT/DnrJ/EryC1/StrS family aminotransferase [Polynucleobacter sp. JS-Mosq-20-D10]|nr:DegT/DnrJ/EryC1/StrS family aminotransferase [Polynucleobacter sp. JS-Mosq-20-D10]